MKSFLFKYSLLFGFAMLFFASVMGQSKKEVFKKYLNRVTTISDCGDTAEINICTNISIERLIKEYLQYPPEAYEKRIGGEVIIRYEVDEVGDVINEQILKSPGYGIGEAVLKVISSFDGFYKSGSSNGRALIFRNDKKVMINFENDAIHIKVTDVEAGVYVITEKIASFFENFEPQENHFYSAYTTIDYYNKTVYLKIFEGDQLIGAINVNPLIFYLKSHSLRILLVTDEQKGNHNFKNLSEEEKLNFGYISKRNNNRRTKIRHFEEGIYLNNGHTCIGRADFLPR